MARYTISYLSYPNSKKATEYSQYRATQGFYSRGIAGIASFFAAFFYLGMQFYIFEENEPLAFFAGIAGLTVAFIMYFYAFHIREERTKYKCERIILDESNEIPFQDQETYLKEKRKQIKQTLVEEAVSSAFYVYSIAIGIFLILGVIFGIVHIVNGKSCATLVFFIAGLIIGIIVFIYAREEFAYYDYTIDFEKADSLNTSDYNGIRTIKETFFCRKCGATIPRDSVFCPECGEQVVVSETSSLYNKKNTDRRKIPFVYKLVTRIIFYIAILILACFCAETIAPFGYDKSIFLLISLVVAGFLVFIFRRLRDNHETLSLYTLFFSVSLMIIVSSIIIGFMYSSKKDMVFLMEPDSKQISAIVSFNSSDSGTVDTEHFDTVSSILVNGKQVDSGELITIDFSDQFDLEYTAYIIAKENSNYRAYANDKIMDTICFDDIKNKYQFESTVIVSQKQTFTVKGEIERYLSFWDIVFYSK